MCRRCTLRVAIVSLVVSLVVGGGEVRGQAPTDTACTYRRCALGIVPAWNGLLITRGAAHERVANLGFFWSRSLEGHFAGSDSARLYARRAVTVRRVAAVLTDIGVLGLGYAAVSAARDGDHRRREVAVAVGGAAALGASIPLQFFADGLLSRAVWWQNATYADR